VPKFQDLIDHSGTQVAERSEQRPSDAVLERQKAFLQKEARLSELRRIRLAADAAAPEVRTYDVVRHNGAWRVLYLGRYSAGFDSQPAAIAAAVEKAKSQMTRGRTVVVRLNRTDGQVWPVDLETGNATDPAAAQ
jgi:hypothetical protein